MSSTAPIFYLLLFTFVGAVVFTLLRSLLKKKLDLPLPPGPRRLPIVGSAHLIPKEKEWLTFSTWGKQYGDVVYVSAIGKPMIILNSAKAVIELLDRRGSIYSDRPVFYMAGELVGWKDAVPLRQYDAQHRESRKLLYSYLSPRKVSERLYPILEQKTVEYLLIPMLDSPTKFIQHIRNTVAATVFFVSNGHVVKGSDALVDLARKGSEQFSAAAAPGAFLVDIFPILRYVPGWLPGATFKRKAKKWRETAMCIRDKAYLDVKEQVISGTARPSFTAELIQNNPNPTMEQEYLYRWSTAAFYGAGADTTVSAISSFFLAMVLHPEVQKNAQNEIDRVVGNDRLPNFADRQKLPFLEAVVKEVLRWNPVAPLAIPHRSMEDDEYAGYHIPKNSVIIANTWAILHDSTLYPSPFKFLPERFITFFPSHTNSTFEFERGTARSVDIIDGIINDNKLTVNPDPAKFAFGYGRRVCPGLHLADASIWIAAATMLAAYDILSPLDTNGNPEMPKYDYTSGLISHPNKFESRIIPRNISSANLIKNAVQS